MPNWHNAKLQVRILQLHVVICYVMLRSEKLLPLPNLLEKNGWWKSESDLNTMKLWAVKALDRAVVYGNDRNWEWPGVGRLAAGIGKNVAIVHNLLDSLDSSTPFSSPVLRQVFFRFRYMHEDMNPLNSAVLKFLHTPTFKHTLGYTVAYIVYWIKWQDKCWNERKKIRTQFKTQIFTYFWQISWLPVSRPFVGHKNAGAAQ